MQRSTSELPKKETLFILKLCVKGTYYLSSLIPARYWGLKASNTKIILRPGIQVNNKRIAQHQDKTKKKKNPECTNIVRSFDFNFSQVWAKL